MQSEIKNDSKCKIAKGTYGIESDGRATELLKHPWNDDQRIKNPPKSTRGTDGQRAGEVEHRVKDVGDILCSGHVVLRAVENALG